MKRFWWKDSLRKIFLSLEFRQFNLDHVQWPILNLGEMMANTARIWLDWKLQQWDRSLTMNGLKLKWIRFQIVYAESVCKIRPLSTSTDPKWRNVYRRMGLHRVGGSFCAILDLLGWRWKEFPVEKLFRKPGSRPGLVIMPQSAEHIRLKESICHSSRPVLSKISK